MKLLGISGSIIGSKTSSAVNKVLNAVQSIDPQIEIELLDLKDYNVEFVRGLPLSSYNEDTVKVVEKVITADFFIVGTPIYQASISGVLKNLFDHLPTDVFQSKVTGIITTGGTDKHFLVAEYHLKPILSFLKGIMPVNNVFVHNHHFNKNGEINDQEVMIRIQELAKEMIAIQKGIIEYKW